MASIKQVRVDSEPCARPDMYPKRYPVLARNFRYTKEDDKEVLSAWF